MNVRNAVELPSPLPALAIDASVRGRLMLVRLDADGSRRGLVEREAPLDFALPRLLAELDAATAAALVVTVGPGSYTGVRTGMAAALGIAMARGVPLYGCGSLEVVASGAPGDAPMAWAVADAGRGGLYAAMYRRWEGPDGPGIAPVVAPRRVVAAVWLPTAKVPVVALEAVPPGSAVEAHLQPLPDDAGRLDALAAAARAALLRAPLDPCDLRGVPVTADQPGRRPV